MDDVGADSPTAALASRHLGRFDWPFELEGGHSPA